MSRLPKILAQATKGRNGFTLWDDFAVEVETALLLFSLVRQSKPLLAIESGTGQGISTAFIAEALVMNGEGELVTFETSDFFADAARESMKGLPVTVEQGLSRTTQRRPQFVFLDGATDERVAEITFWLTHPNRPLTVVHDARRDYPFHLAEGVYIPGNDGVWIGRAKEQ